MPCPAVGVACIGAGFAGSILRAVAGAAMTTLTRVKACLAAEDNSILLRATFARCFSSCSLLRYCQLRLGSSLQGK